MTKKNYRFFDHTADFGLEIFGVDEKDLFVNAAAALFDLITDTKILAGRHRHVIEVTGQDWPDLMVNWLRELLYLWNGREQLLKGLALEQLEPTRVRAVLTTDDYQPDRHPIRNEIKAVTYHQIETGPYREGWRAKVIFDI